MTCKERCEQFLVLMLFCSQARKLFLPLDHVCSRVWIFRELECLIVKGSEAIEVTKRWSVQAVLCSFLFLFHN